MVVVLPIPRGPEIRFTGTRGGLLAATACRRCHGSEFNASLLRNLRVVSTDGDRSTLWASARSPSMALRESPAAVVNRGEQDAPSQQWDRFGALASGLCAVHCAATALAPALFVLAGLELLLSESAEWTFTALALLFASGALFFGWRRHRSVPVASIFALGILGLLLSRGLEMRVHHDHAHEVSHHGAARLVPEPMVTMALGARTATASGLGSDSWPAPSWSAVMP